MSESLFYKLGRGSLREAKEANRKLAGEIGEVAVYLDEDSLNDLGVAINELYIHENLKFLKGESEMPGSINIDFMVAYIKSRNKYLISDKEVEEASGELL